MIFPAAPEARPKIITSVPQEWSGWTITDAISAAAGLDRADAEALIARGGAWLNRHRVQVSDQTLTEGQILAIHFPPPGSHPAVVTPADVIYEDAALLVLNKSPGVYVTMTPWDATGDLLWAARQFLAARDGTTPTLHLAHRLDRDTTGVVVLSKNPRANAPLAAAFLEHTIHKRYLALSAGAPVHDSFEIRTGHGRGQHGLFRVYPYEAVGTRTGDGTRVVKLMETRLRVVERFDSAALIEAQPLTGRTHQIRLHLAYAGYPIAGDSRYGGPREVAGIVLKHHLLHAAELELPHPVEEQRLHFTAPLPALLAEVLGVLRNKGALLQ